MRKEERRVEFVRFRGGRWNHLQMTFHSSLLSRQEETKGEMLAVWVLRNMTMGTYRTRVQWCFSQLPESQENVLDTCLGRSRLLSAPRQVIASRPFSC